MLAIHNILEYCLMRILKLDFYRLMEQSLHQMIPANGTLDSKGFGSSFPNSKELFSKEMESLMVLVPNGGLLLARRTSQT